MLRKAGWLTVNEPCVLVLHHSKWDVKSLLDVRWNSPPPQSLTYFLTGKGGIPKLVLVESGWSVDPPVPIVATLLLASASVRWLSSAELCIPPRLSSTLSNAYSLHETVTQAINTANWFYYAITSYRRWNSRCILSNTSHTATRPGSSSPVPGQARKHDPSISTVFIYNPHV